MNAHAPALLPAMTIAIVSNVPVFPTYEGNRRRILNLARTLRTLGHQTHFIFLPSRVEPDLDRAAHAAEFGADQVHVLSRGRLDSGLYYARRSAMRVGRRIRRAMGRADAFHLGLDEIYQSPYSRQIRSLQKRRGYDAVMVEYIFNTRAFEAFPKAVMRILDTHDSFADRHLAVRGASSERDYWFSVSPETECRAFRRADVVLAIQDKEARSFSERLGGEPPRMATVSHIVDLSRRLDRHDAVGGAFVGSSNGANLVSIRHFLEHTLPLIVAASPQFRLHVVGGVCDHIPDDPRIVKHGFLPDLLDAYRLAPLSLNPIEAGTGINIKLLDAMAAGVGTVSTETGSRGLGPAFAGGVVTVPDRNPRAFADAVVALVGSEAARRYLGERAYAAAKAWNDHQREALSAALGAVAAQARPR
jgi:glycosyltransferase involved in cell wall biosynthesis